MSFARNINRLTAKHRRIRFHRHSFDWRLMREIEALEAEGW